MEAIRNLTKEIIDDDAVFRLKFKSLSELEMFLLQNPPINSKIFPSMKSEYMAESFAGDPLDLAIQYCHGGYEKNLDIFMKVKKEIDSANVKFSNNRRSVTSVVGSRPNVPAYIAGAPKTMYRLEKVKEKKFIDIYMNIAYSGHTSEEQIRNRGILTLNLISVLESHGIGVNFRVFEACYVAKEVFITEIVLKQPGELLNISRCYYPMCGKEFLRRVMIRVKESMPFLGTGWGVSYGAVLDEKSVRSFMNISDDKILILSPQEMGVKGKDIYEDADEFISRLNLSEEISLPKYLDYRK